MPGYEDPRFLQQVIQELQTKVKKLQEALKLVPNYRSITGPGGSVLAADHLNVGTSVQIGPASTPGSQSMVLTALKDGNVSFPVIQAQSTFEILLVPQIAVYDNRDAIPAAVVVCDEQQAFDAGLTLRTFSHISLVQGGTMRVDGFNTIGYSGSLGPGAGVSRRCGIQWGGSGNWGVDASFPWRYHNAPSSITLTTITDSLNGGTKSVSTIDYFGFMVQVAGTAGGGFTLNRWTASGGN